MPNSGKELEKLIDILATLRGPNGCPWDKEQTYQDISPYLLEEAHEVVEAIDKKDFAELKEELGDLLVHILFFSQLAKEENHFSAHEVIEGACEKLIRRHPHVFGETSAKNTQEVLVNWEKIKQQEKEKKGKIKSSLLEGLPPSLPALIKAFRIGEKTSRVGLDWSQTKGILEKIKEEISELEEAIEKNEHTSIEKEYGDLLLTLANLGRFLKTDPETALRKATHIFIRRFQWIEEATRQNGGKLQDLTANEWDRLWQEAKRTTLL